MKEIIEIADGQIRISSREEAGSYIGISLGGVMCKSYIEEDWMHKDGLMALLDLKDVEDLINVLQNILKEKNEQLFSRGN